MGLEGVGRGRGGVSVGSSFDWVCQWCAVYFCWWCWNPHPPLVMEGNALAGGYEVWRWLLGEVRESWGDYSRIPRR